MITYNEANKISIKEYLANKGIHPIKDHGYYGMYRSPFRKDSNASLKVDYNKNLWIDFGSNDGGTMIDMVMRMENCSAKEAISKLENMYEYRQAGSQIINQPNSSSFHGNNSNNNNSALAIQKVIPITHKALIDYLSNRMIDLDIAKKHYSEIHYSINGRSYFAIGFQNDNKGWVLRNESFKGCSSMDITTCGNIDKQKESCLVFEGFTDYLSYLTLGKISTSQKDIIVLNSVSNLPKAINKLKSYKEIYTYLDNDEAGRKATQIIKESCPIVIDQSTHYTKYKDLNEYLISTKQIQQKEKVQQEVKRKPSRGFRP